MNQQKNSLATTSNQFRKHLRQLEISSYEQYQSWCAQHGFGIRRKRNSHLLDQEIETRKREFADQHLKLRKVRSRTMREHFANLLERIRSRSYRIPKTECLLTRIAKYLREMKKVHQNAFVDLLLRCTSSHTPLITIKGKLDSPCTDETAILLYALSQVSRYQNRWVRPLDQWKSTQRNPHDQFISLVRHLFARYELPRFLVKAWYPQGDELDRKWFLCIASGQNIRTMRTVIPLTKKMGHYYLFAPGWCTPASAFRWAQATALGASEKLAKAITKTDLGYRFVNNDFWVSVICWFIQYPYLNAAEIQRIVEYIQEQRFDPAHTYYAGNGDEINDPPRQPNFSMRGRTPETLLRQIEEWEATQEEEKAIRYVAWNRYFPAAHGWQICSPDNPEEQWRMMELCSSKDLVQEGDRMNHCIATYIESCARQHCSIWSLERIHPSRATPALTIELLREKRLICQARGKNNRVPTPEELSILRLWANQNQFEILKNVLV